MSDHLPECPTCADPKNCIANGHYPSVSFAGPALCSKVCICGELRACEARVRADERERSALLIADAYAKGQRDEREACIAAVEGESLHDNTDDPTDIGYMRGIRDAVAAIRARGEDSA